MGFYSNIKVKITSIPFS